MFKCIILLKGFISDSSPTIDTSFIATAPGPDPSIDTNRSNPKILSC